MGGALYIIFVLLLLSLLLRPREKPLEARKLKKLQNLFGSEPYSGRSSCSKTELKHYYYYHYY